MEWRPSLQQQNLTNVRSKEMLHLFRSKAVYLQVPHTQHKFELAHPCLNIMGYNIPSYGTDRLAFIRFILQNERKLLMGAEVLKLLFPNTKSSLSRISIRTPWVTQMQACTCLISSKAPTSPPAPSEVLFRYHEYCQLDYLKLIIEGTEQKLYKNTKEKSKVNKIIFSQTHSCTSSTSSLHRK
jgi:hypothetical protein